MMHRYRIMVWWKVLLFYDDINDSSLLSMWSDSHAGLKLRKKHTGFTWNRTVYLVWKGCPWLVGIIPNNLQDPGELTYPNMITVRNFQFKILFSGSCVLLGSLSWIGAIVVSHSLSTRCPSLVSKKLPSNSLFTSSLAMPWQPLGHFNELYG